MGPAGPAGPPGPAGTVAPTYVTSDPIDLPAGEIVAQIATCPAGMAVIGGGSFTPPIDPAIHIVSSTSIPPDTWSVTMSNQSTTDPIFVAEAICTAA